MTPNPALNRTAGTRLSSVRIGASRGLACALGGIVFEPVDANGQRLVTGSRVRLLFTPDELVSGLPIYDQAAIQGIVGVDLSISDFDEHGHAELMFRDNDAKIHFIWVRPSALILVT